MNKTNEELRNEIPILIKRMREEYDVAWTIEDSIHNAPSTSGCYEIYDGSVCRIAGETHNIRETLQELVHHFQLKRPIFT